MAQTVNLRLSRSDKTPWGFRLQGGKDFGQPLLIQKVNGGSLAERAGLLVGDSLIRVNNVEVADLRHKEAQDVIVNAGNNIDISVQRGGSSTWKPQVSPVGVVPQPGKSSPAAPVTKTSLAAGRSPAPAIGSGHNISPKPFATGPQVNGDPSVKAIVNKQYNTPVQMYSEQTIAETLSAQAEVLAGGAIGVNFMKNEKTYDSQKSEVFKMVQEVDKEPREPDQPDLGTPAGPGSGLRHVLPPEPKPAPASPQPQQLPPGQNICADCERLIVGVFVRIKDKNLHVECFKCATCGTSLKNVGYYNINNKLYCDIHAKMVARQNPPAPNVDPITVAPGAKIPVGAFTTPQTAAAPQSPQPGTLAPLPFHTSAPSGPKPFGSVSAPSAPSTISFPPSVISPASAPAPTVPQPPLPSSFSKQLPEHRTPIIWPPNTQSSFIPPKSEETIYKFGEKRLSICSEEVSSIANRKLEINGSILEEDRPSSPVPDRPVSLEEVEKSVIEASERIKHRSVSPKPPKSPRSSSPRPMTPRHFKIEDPNLLDISTKPHDIHSLLPPASAIRPMSPKQVVVFPPDIPAVIYSRSPTPRRDKKSPDRCTTCPSPLNALVPYKEKHEVHVSQLQIKEQFSQKEVKKSEISKKDTKHTKEQKERSLHKKKQASETKIIQENETEATEINSEVKKETTQSSKVDKMFYTKSEVEKLIHEEVLKALALKEEKTVSKEEKVKEEVISVHDLPKPIAPSGKMASALTTASDRPFTPIPFPKPMELPSISERIIPMEPIKVKKDEKPVPLPQETKPYFPPPPPPPDKEGLDDRTARAFREVGCRSPMTEALTVAPERSYSPLPTFSEVKQSESAFKPILNNKKQMSLSSALTIAPSVPFTVPGKTPIPTASTTAEVQKTSAFKPVTPKTIDKFGVDMTKIAEGRHTKETVKFIESGQIMKTSEKHSQKKLIPYYQENIGEIPIRNRSISPVPHLIVAPSIKPTPPFIPQPSKPNMEVHVSRSEAFQQSSKIESEKAEFVRAKTIPVRPTTPSGLHAPQELPYYQQNIGIIPVRNKSISPLPHPIKAPQLESNYSSSKQQEYKSTVYSETKTYSAQKNSSKTLSSNTTVTKELTVPDRQPSPQTWKLETKRTVQNLSPITVRLSSPRPPTPLQGETEQAANAKVQIHRPRPSSPLPPTIKVEVDYPPVTSTTTSIGSGKSAFATVKNGSSHSQKSIDQSICNRNEGKSTCSGASKKQLVQKESDCCQKSLQSTNQSIQNKQSVKGIYEKSVSSVSKEESVSSQQKVSHSGITSFRAYGESSCKTIASEEYGSEKHCGTLKMERASKAKTFEQKSDSTDKLMSQAKCVESVQHSAKSGAQTYSKSGTEQRQGGKSVSQAKSVESVQHSSMSGTQSYSKSGTEQRYGEKSVIKTTDQKSNLPIINLPVLAGSNKGSLNHTSCPLPTFPSLPQLSDVPWTPGAGGAGGRTGTLAGSTAPKRGRGILNPSVAPGARIPLCGHCNTQIRGPFITALGKIWCPEHFVCVNAKCRRPLQDIGFVEEQDGLYCEFCFEQYLAPTCDKCHSKIKGDCLNAIGKHFHPECFSCAYCGKLFGNNPFFLEDTLPYCENDWNELFTTKCFSCGFPIEAGDRWVEALNNNYHSQCFNCTMCKKNLEGQTFFAKAGRPFCRNHVR